MANFWASMDPVDGNGTSLSFSARMTNGDSDFTGYRVVDVYIEGIGLVASVYDYVTSYGTGGTSSFSETISGLSPGTTYSWSANLFYAPPRGDGPGWITGYLSEVNTGLSGYGSATTYSGGGGYSAYINNGSTWIPATPYIYNGSTWVQATSYIGSGSEWIQCI